MQKDFLDELDSELSWVQKLEQSLDEMQIIAERKAEDDEDSPEDTYVEEIDFNDAEIDALINEKPSGRTNNNNNNTRKKREKRKEKE